MTVEFRFSISKKDISLWDFVKYKKPAHSIRFDVFLTGTCLAHAIETHSNTMRNAWLIGVYTIEMECRIEDLGYSLSRVFATSDTIDSFQNCPELIVFADDGLNTAEDMKCTRKIFPEALIISVAANHIFLEDCLSYTQRRSGEQSVARLIHQIHEREHRWDN